MNKKVLMLVTSLLLGGLQTLASDGNAQKAGLSQEQAATRIQAIARGRQAQRALFAQDENGDMPLHCLLENMIFPGYDAHAEILLQKMISVADPENIAQALSVQNNLGNSLLHLAIDLLDIYPEAITLVNQLLNAGVAKHQLNNRKESPLMLLTMQKNPNVELFDRLLQDDAPIEAFGRAERSILFEMFVYENFDRFKKTVERMRSQVDNLADVIAEYKENGLTILEKLIVLDQRSKDAKGLYDEYRNNFYSQVQFLCDNNLVPDADVEKAWDLAKRLENKNLGDYLKKVVVDRPLEAQRKAAERAQIDAAVREFDRRRQEALDSQTATTIEAKTAADTGRAEVEPARVAEAAAAERAAEEETAEQRRLSAQKSKLVGRFAIVVVTAAVVTGLTALAVAKNPQEFQAGYRFGKTALSKFNAAVTALAQTVVSKLAARKMVASGV